MNITTTFYKCPHDALHINCILQRKAECMNLHSTDYNSIDVAEV